MKQNIFTQPLGLMRINRDKLELLIYLVLFSSFCIAWAVGIAYIWVNSIL